MPHLAAWSQVRVLDLSEVAHVDALGQVRTFAQVRKRPDVHALLHNSAFDHRRLNGASIADGRIANDGVGPQTALAANGCRALEVGAGIDDRVLTDLDGSIYENQGRGKQSHSFQHPLLVYALAHGCLSLGQMRTIVDSQYFGDIADLQRFHHLSLSHGHGYQIGQVILALGAEGQLGQVGPEPMAVEAIDTAVELADRLLLLGGYRLLHDADYLAGFVAQDAPKPHRVVGLDSEHGDRDSSVPMKFQQSPQGVSRQEGHVGVPDRNRLTLAFQQRLGLEEGMPRA